MKHNRYFLPIVALFILIFCGYFSNAEEIQLSNDGETSIVMKENNYTKLHLINNLYDLGHFVVKTDQGYFSELKVTGYSKAQVIGSPMLPMMRKLIEIPVDAIPEVHIISYEVEEYSLFDLGIDHPLMPAQPPYIKSDDMPPPFEYDASVYNQDSFWGKEIASVEVLGYMRGTRIARVDIAPFEYNPVSHTIKIYHNVEVEIIFRNANISKTIELKTKMASPYFEGLNKQFINYKPLILRDTISKSPIKYVIVSDPMFYDQLQPFIEWKTKKGFNVIQAYTDDPQVGTTTASIKAYIQDLYEAGTVDDPAPSYVLFVGDVDQIPAWNLSGPSDLKYCEFTNDYFPEIYYGRFSAQNTVQLQPQIDKTLQYEQFTMPDPSYLEEAVLVAGMDSGFGNDWANGQINYGTENYFNAAHGFVTYVYLYPESGGQAAEIRQRVSDGVGFGNYTAHCGSSGWSDPSFSTSHIPALQNQDKYGVLIGNCCCSNEFSVNSCFGEALLRTENKGAVGYVGGSNNTMWDEDYYWAVGVGLINEDPPPYEETTMGVYDGLFHDHGEPESDWYITLDQIVFQGNLAVTEGLPSSAQYYWDIYCVMGDPSLITYLAMPVEMTVSYDALMPLSSTSFTVTADPFAYVAISKEGVLYGAAMADETGMVDVPLTPITVPGTADVVVTCQNRQPFIGTVTVASPEGPYVLLNDFEIDDISGNNNNLPDFGEDILLNIKLENVGNSDATGITATISSTDDYVSITKGIHECSDILSGETSTEDGAFAMSIADFVPDQHSVSFNLDVTDGSETWSSSLAIKLYAPALSVGSYQIDDSELGNDNGRLDPGEMVEITITALNEGHSDAPGTVAYLSTTSDYVTLNYTEFEIGDLVAESSAETIFSLTIDPAAPIGSMAELNFEIDGDPYFAEKTFSPKVGLIVEDFETGDFYAYDWILSGNGEWTIVETAPHSGMYCAKSGSIGHNQTTIISITLEVSADDSIAFYRKVSSEEGYDYLKFYIDNSLQGQWAGNLGWERMAFPVSVGEHTFIWEYEKDSYVSNGSDCGWIDYIIFPTMDVNAGPLSLEAVAYPDELCSGTSSRLFAIPSGGTGDYSYQWTPAASLDDPTIFNPVATPDESMVYTVEVSDGDDILTAEISLTVIPTPEQPTINQIGEDLVSSAEYGNQWYLWGEPLQGATNQVLTPTGTGNYYTIVTGDNGCESESSNTIYYIYTSVDDLETSQVINIFPNPITDQVNIEYALVKNSDVKITIINSLGKVVSVIDDIKDQPKGKHLATYNTSQFSAGVYYCKFETSEKSRIDKIIIVK